MAKNWHWIELIGFDNKKSDYGVEDFLSRLKEDPEGVSILCSHIDFINSFDKDKGDYPLLPCYCSYSSISFLLIFVGKFLKITSL